MTNQKVRLDTTSQNSVKENMTCSPNEPICYWTPLLTNESDSLELTVTCNDMGVSYSIGSVQSEFTFGQQVEETLAELYEILDGDSIAPYLSPEMDDILRQAHTKLIKYLPGLELSLTVYRDTDYPSTSLLNLSVKGRNYRTDSKNFDEFCEKWWFENSHRVEHKLFITLDF